MGKAPSEMWNVNSKHVLYGLYERVYENICNMYVKVEFIKMVL